MTLNHRERILTTLSHKEPDHVPIDIGGSDVTGIHRDAYRHLARVSRDAGRCANL